MTTPRGAHRPPGRRQPGQRDRHRGQREGALRQAPGHDRQHERDHRQDQLGAGQRRAARDQRPDHQEPERRAGRRQGGRQQRHGRAHGGQEAQLRPGDPGGVPDGSRKGEGLPDPGHPAGGQAALLSLRALQPAAGLPAGARPRSRRRPIRDGHTEITRNDITTYKQRPAISAEVGYRLGTLGRDARASSRARAEPASTTSRSRTACASRPRCSISAARTTAPMAS